MNPNGRIRLIKPEWINRTRVWRADSSATAVSSGRLTFRRWNENPVFLILKHPWLAQSVSRLFTCGNDKLHSANKCRRFYFYFYFPCQCWRIASSPGSSWKWDLTLKHNIMTVTNTSFFFPLSPPPARASQSASLYALVFHHLKSELSPDCNFYNPGRLRELKTNRVVFKTFQPWLNFTNNSIKPVCWRVFKDGLRDHGAEWHTERHFTDVYSWRSCTIKPNDFNPGPKVPH